MSLYELNKWFGEWEPLWLFVLLTAEAIASFSGVIVIAKRLTQRRTYQRKKPPAYESLNVGESR